MLDNVYETVLVMDLDDTLYKEVTYSESGIKAVCTYIENLYPQSICLDSILLLNKNKEDWLSMLCKILKLPLSVKESLLWIYRLHQPKISLDKSTKASINKLQQVAKLVILTDGRSISQRQKIKSLELDHLPVYISEEYQSEKPDLLRFNLIMKDLPSKKYTYVGDNPRKDFIAPNKLNWNTIGLRGDGYNIHSQDSYTQDARPKLWINNLEELLHIL